MMRIFLWLPNGGLIFDLDHYSISASGNEKSGKFCVKEYILDHFRNLTLDFGPSRPNTILFKFFDYSKNYVILR